MVKKLTTHHQPWCAGRQFLDDLPIYSSYATHIIETNDPRIAEFKDAIRDKDDGLEKREVFNRELLPQQNEENLGYYDFVMSMLSKTSARSSKSIRHGFLSKSWSALIVTRPICLNTAQLQLDL